MTITAPSTTGRGGTLRRVFVWVFFIAAAFVLYRAHVYHGPKTVDVAALDLRDLNGEPLPVSELAGKAVVLNFWAPWCGPCRTEMPWLERLQQEHPEVVVIGVEDDPGVLDEARGMVRSSALKYRTAEPGPQVQRIFGDIRTLPTTLYISASGRVVHTASGLVPETVMRYYVRDTVAQR